MLEKTALFKNWKRRRWKDPGVFAAFHSNLAEAKLARSVHLDLPYQDAVSWNISITNYAQNGELDIARRIFDEMQRQRTVVSWNTMLSGYAKWGENVEALNFVALMHRCGTRPNETTFSSVLSVCARCKAPDYGLQLHCLVFKTGFENFEFVGTSLLDFYVKCFRIDDACQLFDILHHRNPFLWSLMLAGYVQCNRMKDAVSFFERMPTRDVFSWTALISGFSQSEEAIKAFKYFRLMRASGEILPNEFTFDSMLRACSRLEALNQGRLIHGCLIKSGFESDCSIGSALIEVYCKCDNLEDSIRVFDRLQKPCLNSSNSLIQGLISMGRIEDAEKVFNAMVDKNPVSYNLMIKGYAQSGRTADSKNLFDEMPQRTLASSNTMISIYWRKGEFCKARDLFEATKEQGNTVTWNSMISGYLQTEQPEESLKLYVNMHRSVIECNRSTFSVVISACSALGALQQGRLLHTHVAKTPFESNVFVGTSLVDMYAKCGSITDARKSFLRISSPNVASWTALINGHAHHGLGTEALSLFEQMVREGIEPNQVTFVGVLSACGSSGLMRVGMEFFRAMENDYGLVPTIEHYTCVVDLLGRSGYLREAEEFIYRMPIEADCVVWGALLSASWCHLDAEVGERVAERMFRLEPKQISSYVILSNIYAAIGKWGEVLRVRKRLRNMEVKKDPGCSWIEVKGTVHVFCVEDRNHPDIHKIYALLEELTVKAISMSEFS